MSERKPMSPAQFGAFWDEVKANSCPVCLGYSFCYCGGPRQEGTRPNYVRDRSKGAQGD